MINGRLQEREICQWIYVQPVNLGRKINDVFHFYLPPRSKSFPELPHQEWRTEKSSGLKIKKHKNEASLGENESYQKAFALNGLKANKHHMS